MGMSHSQPLCVVRGLSLSVRLEVNCPSSIPLKLETCQERGLKRAETKAKLVSLVIKL